ncbi:Harmonin [Nymphon striatum]|nr:Harmonin [Nymphon striatum]
MPPLSLLCGIQSRENIQRNEIIETEVFIHGADSSAGLGCSIANGPEEKPGIFVQTTKVGGLAHEAGLRTGDQIIKMNDTNLENVLFSKAVSLLKSSPNLRLIVLKSAGLDLFMPEITQHQLDFIHRNGYNESSDNSAINGQISNDKQPHRLSPFSSNCDDSSSHNSSDHLISDREVSSSVGTRSSLSDDQPCSSSDDAGSLTSSEIYGELIWASGGRTLSNVQSSSSSVELMIQIAGDYTFQRAVEILKRSNGYVSIIEVPLVLGRWKGTDSLNSVSSFRKEQERLAEERKKLEQDQLRLQEETKQLSKEKQKLEEEKKKQLSQTSSPAKPQPTHAAPDIKPFVMPPKSCGINFLSELREKSIAREQRSLEGSSISSRGGSPRDNSKHRGFSTDSDGENGTEDLGTQTRKQHELLMKEFKAAHMKMFRKNNNDSDEISCDSLDGTIKNSEILPQSDEVADPSAKSEAKEVVSVEKELVLRKTSTSNYVNGFKALDSNDQSKATQPRATNGQPNPTVAVVTNGHSKPVSSIVANGHSKLVPAVAANGYSKPVSSIVANGNSKPVPAVVANGHSKPAPAVVANDYSKPAPAVVANGHSKLTSAVVANGYSKPAPAVVANGHSKLTSAVVANGYSKPAPAVVANGHSKLTSAVVANGYSKPAPAVVANGHAKPISAVVTNGHSKPTSALMTNSHSKIAPALAFNGLSKPTPAVFTNGHLQNGMGLEAKILRRNVKCPAPPPPPKTSENENGSPTTPEKRVTILPEATDIATSANKEEKIQNKLQNKTSNGILKKPTPNSQKNSSTDNKKFGTSSKVTSFADNLKSTNKIERKMNVTNSYGTLRKPTKDSVNTSTFIELGEGGAILDIAPPSPMLLNL